jgi:hypothetical protein
MKAFKDVAKSVGIGLIVFTIEQIIVFAISQLITGSALQWWQRFDFVTVIIIGGTTGGAVAVALTLYRLRQIKKNKQLAIFDKRSRSLSISEARLSTQGGLLGSLGHQKATEKG